MPPTLSNEQKIAVFREMVSGWQRKEWRKCADLFTPDGVLQSMMKEPVVGREVFFERMVNLAASNKKITLHVHRVGVIDGAVVSERTDEIVIDGVSRTVPVVGIMEFDGPLISHWREYYDLAQLRRAQGKEAPAAHCAA